MQESRKHQRRERERLEDAARNSHGRLPHRDNSGSRSRSATPPPGPRSRKPDSRIPLPDVKEKLAQIHKAIDAVPTDLSTLRHLAISDGGLLNGLSEEQQETLKEALLGIICRILIRHPHLHYYQGYHDIALTVLLVVRSKKLATAILESISKNHLKEYMEPTMETTMNLLNVIFPILRDENYPLFQHIFQSRVGAMFSVPWVITWFSHHLDEYEKIARLFDCFIACPRHFPIYLVVAVVLHRHQEILDTEKDIAMFPKSLTYDALIGKAQELQASYPLTSNLICTGMKLAKESQGPSVIRRKGGGGVRGFFGRHVWLTVGILTIISAVAFRYFFNQNSIER
ncbi:unnamed protein product [Darwinula stevensoni]|uniref:Rab-GAP TBC domain-containing protein n=1 Tax=Darwinula stevensoni TaxID=69355 RepID=A0A7R9AEH8_9CRUS|nr:unnamed protein product [Darwinula stevensoni]CAG0902425.1 unnamed protein product [Darwinula stevensoni]